LQKYFELGQDKDASRVVTESANTAKKWGISRADNSHLELLRVFVSVINTVPSPFWLLSYILNDAKLLKDIRAEILRVVTRAGDSISMDITKFHSNCPLYVSTWQETLRHISAGGAIRQVKTDSVLPNTYLLKAGSSIQMPAGVLHQSPSTWGNDVGIFNARCFLKASDLP
jgi:Cytochrome P450